jgi:hypothetical protein
LKEAKRIGRFLRCGSGEGEDLFLEERIAEEEVEFRSGGQFWKIKRSLGVGKAEVRRWRGHSDDAKPCS